VLAGGGMLKCALFKIYSDPVCQMQYINGLHFNNLRGDIYGGLTAAVVALPLAMAMGVASGVGPIAGLYGAIFVGFFAAILGGTPAQVSGPTGPMTVVMAAIFTHYTGMFPDDPLHGATLAFTVVILITFYYLVSGGITTETASLVGGAIASAPTIVEKLTEDGFPIQQRIKTGFPDF